jgi:WD40 repeat protein
MLLLAAATILLSQEDLPLEPQFLHDAKVVNSALSPDGEILVALDEDGTLYGWRCQPRKRLYTRRMLKRGDTSRRLTCSPDGRYLAISGKECPGALVLVLGLSDGKEVHRFERGFSPAFSPDGEFLACSDGKQIRRWAMKSGAELPALDESPFDLKWVAWASTGHRIAASRQIGWWVASWDVLSRQLVNRLEGAETGPVTFLTFDPGGQKLAVGSHWGLEIRSQTMSKASDDQLIREYVRGEVMFSGGGRELIWCDRQQRVSVCERSSGVVLFQWAVPATHDGLLEVCRSGRFLIWMEDRGIRLERIPSFLGGRDTAHPITCVGFTSDGKAVTGGKSGTVRLWDPETEKEVGGYKVPDLPLIRFSADVSRAVFRDEESGVILWDLASEKQLLKVDGHPPINAVALSPDGRTLGLALLDGSVALWDIASRKEKDRIRMDAGSVQDITWSPDGKTLAWATFGGQVVFSEGEHGGERVVYAPRGRSVHKIEFLNDGKRLRVVNPVGESLCYDGRLDREPEAPSDELWVPERISDSRWLRSTAWKQMWGINAFSRDGRYAISADGYGSAMIWRAPWER